MFGRHLILLAAIVAAPLCGTEIDGAAAETPSSPCQELMTIRAEREAMRIERASRGLADLHRAIRRARGTPAVLWTDAINDRRVMQVSTPLQARYLERLIRPPCIIDLALPPTATVEDVRRRIVLNLIAAFPEEFAIAPPLTWEVPRLLNLHGVLLVVTVENRLAPLTRTVLRWFDTQLTEPNWTRVILIHR